ncbi:MAG: hypothetical protein PH343_01695 [Nitrospira sp.]|nr:hypothetical protein [Nitrospira sp.]
MPLEGRFGYCRMRREILAPVELREEVIRQMKEMLRKYGDV